MDREPFGGGISKPLGNPLQGFRKIPRERQRPQAQRGFPLRLEARDIQRRKPDYLVGPGEIPAGFDGPTVSRDEWVWYWASCKVMSEWIDPRVGPWNGDTERGTWDYQVTFRAGSGPASRPDFVYHLADEDVAIRIQSERFHIMAEPEIKAYDFLQLINLHQQIRVEDAYSQDWVEDRSGQAAIVALKHILAGGESLNPISAGTARTTRFDKL